MHTRLTATVNHAILQIMILSLLCLVGAEVCHAQTPAAIAPADANNTAAPQIEANYQKRYPYAKAAASNDSKQGQDSQAGTPRSYTAYIFERRQCREDPENPVFGTDIHYEQNLQQVVFSPPSRRDNELFETGLIKSYGLPCSDSQYQLIDRENRQRFLELLFDPERWMWTQTASSHLEALAVANSVAGAAESSFKTAFQSVNQPLINIANEGAAVALGRQGGEARSQGQAVFIVQQMYKLVFMPMSILLLLPGALLTQIKGMVGFGFLGSKEDASSPFEGFLRALVAVFLIPTTQLIISYSIDVGNSLAGAVCDPLSQFVQPQLVFDWAKEQTFNPSLTNVANGILPAAAAGTDNGGTGLGAAGAPGGVGGNANTGGISGVPGSKGPSGFFNITFSNAGPVGQSVGNALSDFLNRVFGALSGQTAPPGAGGQGKVLGQSEAAVSAESQLFLSSILQIGFNGFACLSTYALTVLSSYQLVFMCYLLLMGPIAACFFAWPSGCGSLFRGVFVNWLNAVVVLSLWRFYWCAILAVMTQRLIQLRPNPNSPQEMMVYSCFLVLMLYIPFHPFSFSPGEIVSELLDKVTKGGGQAAQGAALPVMPIGAKPEALVETQSNRATTEFTKIASRSGNDVDAKAVQERETALDKVSQEDAAQRRPKANIFGGLVKDDKLPPSVLPASLLAMSFDRLPPVADMAEKLVDEAGAIANLDYIKLLMSESIGVLSLEPHDKPVFVVSTTDTNVIRQGIEGWQKLISEGSLDLPAPPVAQTLAALPESKESGSGPGAAGAAETAASPASLLSSSPPGGSPPGLQSKEKQSRSALLKNELQRSRYKNRPKKEGDDEPWSKPPPPSNMA